VIDRDELAAWLRLLETPRVGRETARRLLAAFGSPEAVFDASAPARREVVSATVADALARPPEGFEGLLSATTNWLSSDGGAPRDAVALGHAAYPKALLETADPPLLLYVHGNVDLLNAASLAVVGSRNPTPQGLANARSFSAHLSECGHTIVSGLALGIDTAAHEGGLSGRGQTIAVVGTGLDRVYPRRNLQLAHRIATAGLLVSEFAPGTPPLAAHFPMRNRIIAGLSRGTLVVEAALQSGSLITARQAAEAGREVFAIPGSIHSPQARGCHALIKQGAKLVETAADILDELQIAFPLATTSASDSPPIDGSPSPSIANGGESPGDPLLEAMGYDPVSLEALTARTGWSTSALQAKLLELELGGQVARLPGQMFQRAARG
jgi:DNA processing protein